MSYTIQDKNLIASLAYLKEIGKFPKNKAKPNFESVREAEEAAKEDVVSVINEGLHGLQQDISDIQKKGVDLRLEGIRLLQVPLKTKVWLATVSREDLEKIFEILSEVEKKIIPLKEKVLKE